MNSKGNALRKEKRANRLAVVRSVCMGLDTRALKEINKFIANKHGNIRILPSNHSFLTGKMWKENKNNNGGLVKCCK